MLTRGGIRFCRNWKGFMVLSNTSLWDLSFLQNNTNVDIEKYDSVNSCAFCVRLVWFAYFILFYFNVRWVLIAETVNSLSLQNSLSVQ
jgi:hypothetical protein